MANTLSTPQFCGTGVNTLTEVHSPKSKKLMWIVLAVVCVVAAAWQYSRYPITDERKFKQSSTGKRAYTYYRCAKYNRSGHPRTRVREEELDEQILTLFDRIRIQDDAVREWFRAVLASQTRDQHETRSQRDELQRQLTITMNQQDCVVNLRVDGEIDAEVFAKKQTEIRDRMASLKVQMDALDRNRDEMADLERIQLTCSGSRHGGGSSGIRWN